MNTAKRMRQRAEALERNKPPPSAVITPEILAEALRTIFPEHHDKDSQPHE
jgi:hypothetical protein